MELNKTMENVFVAARMVKPSPQHTKLSIPIVETMPMPTRVETRVSGLTYILICSSHRLKGAEPHQTVGMTLT